MGTYIEIIMEALSGIPSREAIVFLISMLPVVELRGRFLPVPFILLLIRYILNRMKMFRLTSELAYGIEQLAMDKSDQIGVYEFWGLLVFVAIPLPGTGAWTGALVGALLGMPFGKAMLAVFNGVLISAAVQVL